MKVEIVTPEAILFKGEVKSVTVPSVEGSFQILENHAPIIAILEKGEIKIKGIIQSEIFAEKAFEQRADELILPIKTGTIEHKNNHSIILAE